MEIEADVARTTETGFALEFRDVEPRLQSFLELAVRQAAERAQAGEEDDTEPEIPKLSE